MALVDSWELAQQLVTGGHGSMEAAINEYALKAAPRSKEAITGSHKIIAMAHSKGVIKLFFIGLFKVLGLLMGPGVGALFWLRKRA